MSRPRPEYAITVARHDLDTAIALARQVRASGLAPAPLKQIALASDPDANPDTFMQKFYSAAKYGLVSLHRERIGMTGQAVTLPLLDALDDPAREQEVRATAFLHIPLHRAFAERYRDQFLPVEPEVQRILAEEFGVSAGQVANVRRVLLRSLRQAGLLDADGGRIVLPMIPVTTGDAIRAREASDLPTRPPIEDDAAIRQSAEAYSAAISNVADLPALDPAIAVWVINGQREWGSWPKGKRKRWHAALDQMLGTLSHRT